MIRRMTVTEVAAGVGRHYKTVLAAVQLGDLHGVQSGPKGTWSIREDCAEAWADRQLCEHQLKNVIPMARRRAGGSA